MDIQRLIQDKRAQIAKLEAQVEVLEELAGGERASHNGRPTPTGRRSLGRAAGPGRRGARAGRGENQQKLLAVLSATPMRARDIAQAAGLSASMANQTLLGLRRKRIVTKAGRGRYKLTAQTPARAAAVNGAEGGGRGTRRARRAGRPRPRKTGRPRSARPATTESASTQ